MRRERTILAVVLMLVAASACRHQKPPIHPPPDSYTITTESASFGSSTEELPVAHVSVAFFDQMMPLMGRKFTSEDFRASGPSIPVAILTHQFWKGRLNGDPSMIGKPIRVADRAVTIVGVIPPEVVFEKDVAVLVPAQTR